MRRTCVGLLLLLGVMEPALAAPRRPPAPSGPAPYCIARGGAEGGGSFVGNCRFYDFESCAQAAAAGGNCVRNPDAR
jgi:hypothetical protein